MPSVVATIANSAVGLLCDKASCDPTATKLEDGDLADVKILEIVVRNLEGIKMKFRHQNDLFLDILRSLAHLTEGVHDVHFILDHRSSKLEQEAVVDPIQQDHGETSRMSSNVESGISSETLELSHAIKMMQIYSDERFQFAKKGFKEARIFATKAYCNELLNIKDRILAAKLRVVSEILECLDSPQMAITECLSFLQDLHSLPAIPEMFSAYLSRTKSLFGNDNRLEVVKSVMMINYFLYQFTLKFSGQKLTDMFTWPATIQLDNGRSFNPILDWREVATRKSMGDKLSQLRDPFKLLLYERAMPVLSAMNNRKLVVEKKEDEIK